MMAGLLWYRSYMDSLANTSGYYPDIHAGHADRVTELTLDSPYLVRETPAGYNQLELMKLVGGTVAWNQLTTAFRTTAYSGISRDAVSSDLADGLRVHGTSGSDSNYTLVTGVDGFVNGHMYFFTLGNVQLPSGSRINNARGGIDKASEVIYPFTYIDAFGLIINSGIVIDVVVHPQIFDLTQMLGSAIADYAYSLEQATAGSGIAWLKSYGYFTEDYYAYSAPTLQSVEATAHVTKDSNNTTIATYPLDSDLVLRGIPKLDNGVLSYDGDTYEWDGTVTRYFGERAYQAGDESLTDAITNGTDTVYKLQTPTTESADPYTAVQDIEEGGTEEFVTGNSVPVGNVSVYRRV